MAEDSIKHLKKSLMDHLTYDLAKDMYSATPRDKFNSVLLSVRKPLMERWIRTQQLYYEVDAKRVYYLSLEFLLGRLLDNYILNSGLSKEYKEAVGILGMDYEELSDIEWDAGLGNGGLGRLAACFLDSMATLQYPAYGYGIRYEYGIFSQKIEDGFQTEAPDNWLRYGNLWEIPRPELIYPVHFHGRVNTVSGSGRFRMEWTDTDDVMAMAYDYPVPGFRNDAVNTLRLWAAKSTRGFNLDFFNSGDYIKAVENKSKSEYISKVLYPSDESIKGKELRLKQQYFFVSATIRDIVRRYKKFHHGFHAFPDKVAVQLNDTHPSIAIAELMRILVDKEGIPWEDAWKMTARTFAYTNHTVLPEALESWPESLFAYLLPRHLQIIQEIDRRFLIQAGIHFRDDQGQLGKMAIIAGDREKSVHMSRLAIIGSHTVNGVSKLHSDILKDTLFHSFYQMMPDKFKNITNGITPRRWLLQANPQLSNLITEAIGERWQTDTGELIRLEPFANDNEFCRRFRDIKISNKETLSGYLSGTCEFSFPPELLLDCQIKRFHEYKRQLLNILHIITLYNRIREGKQGETFVPRAFLFSGKAAPGYYMCKLIIKLINAVSSVISFDPHVKDKLQVLFVPNYGVTLAQNIIPAADLSEQISTAGYEASGTGNMKFTMNGALTIGTLDGANVEIREDVGEDNFFLFGLRAEEIVQKRATYNPRSFYEQDQELKQAIDQIFRGDFYPEDPQLFHPIVYSLLGSDYFFVLADYDSYIKSQERVSEVYLDKDKWTKMAVLNVARSGNFSSDRAIKEYAEKIWRVSPVPVNKE